MLEASYSVLVEHLTESEDLAEHARDMNTRAKAAELAHDYRTLISYVERLLANEWGIAKCGSINAPNLKDTSGRADCRDNGM